jgi:hypothetical protein
MGGGKMPKDLKTRPGKTGIEKYKYEVAQEIGRFSSSLKISPETIEKSQNSKK